MPDPVTRWLHRRAQAAPAAILMYHAVTPGRTTPAWPWAVSLADFCAQLDWLAEAGYATPTVSELVREPARFGARTAVITFDDGYADNLAAWEELTRRGMKATWYVTTGYLGRTHPWRDARPQGRLLAAEELRAMAASGMEIGSHTVTHPRLPELSDDMIRRELTEAKATLEEVLGQPVESFAYPFGAWDERCEALVKAAGYGSACHTRTGWALRDNDPFRLRRLTVFNTDTLGRFVRKLAWGSHDVSWPQVARYALSRIAARM
jgi:peptidoglycan/xylan/chitin deacetylase (PgdA/CDA1 family)